MFTVLNFSGGKDSTAMLLGCIEKGIQIDLVVNCDTTMEFPAMYPHIEKVKKDVAPYIGQWETVSFDFKYYMFHKDVKIRKGGTKNGYGWPNPFIRWCTKIKTSAMNNMVKQVMKENGIGENDYIRMIGLAADEQKRIERGRKFKQNRYPLDEWGWTEADCLKYCYDKGYDFGGLYNYFKRVSCWCCPLQGKKDLYTLYKHFPDLWSELMYLDSQTPTIYGMDYKELKDIEAEFKAKDSQLKLV